MFEQGFLPISLGNKANCPCCDIWQTVLRIVLGKVKESYFHEENSAFLCATEN